SGFGSAGFPRHDRDPARQGEALRPRTAQGPSFRFRFEFACSRQERAVTIHDPNNEGIPTAEKARNAEKRSRNPIVLVLVRVLVIEERLNRGRGGERGGGRGGGRGRGGEFAQPGEIRQTN